MTHPFLQYSHLLELDLISKVSEEARKEIEHNSHWDNYRALRESFPFPDLNSVKLDISSEVQIRSSSEWEKKHHTQVQQIVQSLFPWRKGPFNFLGTEIDAEWRSERKWDRIVRSDIELRNRRVIDVGCNNGYYLFRMLQHDPQFVLGIDPSSRGYYQFDLFQSTLQHPKLHFEPLGVEHLYCFPDFFDVAFCLGVIYHRRDPYSCCRQLFDSLRENGVLYLESLVIPGDEPTTLCPTDRYAKMRNVWYVPTVSCMEVWLRKAGFKEIEVLSVDVVTVEEQRKTELAPYESLSDFLDPEDDTKTIEGYPAPTRAILRALK